jgi:ABC-type Na+ efflux pump permease subunit
LSTLQAAWFVARKDLKWLLRQKPTLVWTFLMPPVFFFFIGTITGGFGGSDAPPEIALVAPEPAGFLADELAARLEEEGYAVRRMAAVDTLVASRLVLPEGFTDSLVAGAQVAARFEREGELDPSAQWDQIRVSRAVYGMLADAAIVAQWGDTASGTADTTAAAAVTAAALSRERARPRTLVLESHPAGGREEPPIGFQQAVPGTMVMFTLLVLLTSGAVLLVIERQQGLLRRVAATPLPRAGVVLGKWGARMGLALVQIAFGLALGTIAFRVDWGPDLPMIGVILLAWAALCAGIGIVAGNLSRTEGQAVGLGVFAANLLAALGGCWWPIEITPGWAQKIALFVPTGWTMGALHRLMSFEAGAASALPHLVALTVAALFVGWAATRTFRYA